MKKLFSLGFAMALFIISSCSSGSKSGELEGVQGRPKATGETDPFGMVFIPQGRTLIGMTAGGIRVVDIPHDFRVGDQRYDDMIQNSNMVYKISLLTVSEEAKPNAICYE